MRTVSNTTSKKKLKMDQIPKCKIIYHKTPRGKHRQNILRHKLQQYHFGSVFYSNENKRKNKQMAPKKPLKCMHSKENHTQNKTTTRIGENFCKQCDCQRIKLQNI